MFISTVKVFMFSCSVCGPCTVTVHFLSLIFGKWGCLTHKGKLKVRKAVKASGIISQSARRHLIYCLPSLCNIKIWKATLTISSHFSNVFPSSLDGLSASSALGLACRFGTPVASADHNKHARITFIFIFELLKYLQSCFLNSSNQHICHLGALITSKSRLFIWEICLKDSITEMNIITITEWGLFVLIVYLIDLAELLHEI